MYQIKVWDGVGCWTELTVVVEGVEYTYVAGLRGSGVVGGGGKVWSILDGVYMVIQ